jgi:hypothetical protein
MPESNMYIVDDLMTCTAHETAQVSELAEHSENLGSFGKRPTGKGAGALGAGWK